MRLRSVLLIVSAAFGLASASARAEKIVYSSDPETDKVAHDFWYYADAPGPGGQKLPKRQLMGNDWYRTPFGLQVDPYCFEMMKPRAAEQIKRELDEHFKEAVDRVVNRCAGAYNEVAPYIQQWAQRLARTALTCTKADLAKEKVAAYNVRSFGGTKSAYLTDAESERLQSLPTVYSEPSSKGFPIIVLPKDGFRKALDGANSAIDVLIHEGFHSTGANNHADHNTIERIDVGGGCQKDVAVDRVCLLASLCSGAGMPPSGVSAQQALYLRMSDKSPSCNRKKACEDAFTGSTGSKTYDGPLSEGLYFDANKLCDKIFNEGCCRDFLATDTGKRHHLNRPEVAGVASRVMDRMERVVPKRAAEVPADLLKAFPESYAALKAVEGTPCFKRFFSGSVDGGLVVKGVENRELSKKERWNRSVEFTYTDALDGVAGKAGLDIDCGDDGNKVRDAVKGFSGLVGSAFNAHTFNLIVGSRATFGFEAAAPSTSDNVAPEQARSEHDFMRLLDNQPVKESIWGKSSLYFEYRRALVKYHPESKLFSCASLTGPEYASLGCFTKFQMDPALFCPAH